MSDLSHFDDAGASRMVDVGDKPSSDRAARATGAVLMAAETLALVRLAKPRSGIDRPVDRELAAPHTL